jgi:hypothetical protein
MELQHLDIREGLTVDLAALSTREALQADVILGSFLGDEPTPGALALMTSKIYSLCSVRKLNDQAVTPLAGGVAFDNVVNAFQLTDLMTLSEFYAQNFMPDLKKAKNLLSAEASVT